MKLYLDILNSINSGVVMADNDHIIRYMDEAAAEHFEKSGGMDLVGRNLFDCHRKESAAAIMEYHEQMKKGELEKLLVRKSHGLDMYMLAIRDENKELVGYAEVFEKLTVQREEVKENSFQKSFRYIEMFDQELQKGSIEFIKNKVGTDNEILDILCGTGELGLGLALNQNNVLSVDNSENMINLVNSKIVAQIEELKGSCKTKVADVKVFTSDKKYDYILLNNNSLNYMYTNNHKVKWLERIKALLKDNGRVIAVVDTPVNDDISQSEEAFNKVFIKKDDFMMVRVSSKIKYFENQKILNYRNDYKMIKDNAIVEEFEDIMRQSIISREELREVFTGMNLSVLDHHIVTQKDSAFQREVFVLQ